jgi:hypothetical protein
MVQLSCPGCHTVLEVPDQDVGTKCTCSRCGQRLVVPSPTQNQTTLGVPVPGSTDLPPVPAGSEEEPEWEESMSDQEFNQFLREQWESQRLHDKMLNGAFLWQVVVDSFFLVFFLVVGFSVLFALMFILKYLFGG